jgi:hypothetical protein
MVVVGVFLRQPVIGAWWVDAGASLGIVWFLVRQEREAWKGKKRCDPRDTPRLSQRGLSLELSRVVF